MKRLALHILPKLWLTYFVGWGARQRFSRIVVPWYIRHYRVFLEEADTPPRAYRSLVALFTRQLKPDARPVALADVVSPVDGRVAELGLMEHNQLLQAKGSTYTLEALLADETQAQQFVGGHYITLYLSPSDYHRIHMPVEGRVTRWIHIPGRLYPVNRHGVQHIRGLFTKNERVVSFVASQIGMIAVVKVGATIVGSVRTVYGSHAKHKRKQRMSETLDYPLAKGQELGHFELGSTVILLFGPGQIKRFLVSTGDVIRVGQALADVLPQADHTVPSGS